MANGHNSTSPNTIAQADSSLMSPPPITLRENGSVPTISTTIPATTAESVGRHPPKALYASPKTARAIGIAFGTFRVRRSLTAATVHATIAHAYGRIVGMLWFFRC